jgi:hypothetical protein
VAAASPPAVAALTSALKAATDPDPDSKDAAIPAKKDPLTAALEADPSLGQLRGPWDPLGYGYRKLEPKYAVEVYQQIREQRWRLQRAMLMHEQAHGFISFDHVMETAKRIKGTDKAMLIACGASGNVLEWWTTTSTSLAEVAEDLKQLSSRQKDAVVVVTVDDPKSMEAELRKAFRDADIKMDAGHVIFSRLGKLLDKTHHLYRE